MESKKDIVKTNQNIKVDINPKEYFANKIEKKQNKIIKKDSETFHDEHGRLLYEPDEEFKSCCFSMDKECVYYCGKMTISMSVLVFSFLMLQNPVNDVAFYTSTISLLLGHFLNTPTAKDKNKKEK